MNRFTPDVEQSVITIFHPDNGLVSITRSLYDIERFLKDMLIREKHDKK